ncbi:hypothetical protein NDU88_000337 [Pleurodeles waltl]|uniref:Uncharacterized protein n=1 Tax=Pleurodeles waltl TaxID=8319 RepID=A0AAV7VX87_PLEWA|nr:hypothetical protein NDU88_000337 [Pleurodeles waltl]
MQDYYFKQGYIANTAYHQKIYKNSEYEATFLAWQDCEHQVQQIVTSLFDEESQTYNKDPTLIQDMLLNHYAALYSVQQQVDIIRFWCFLAQIPIPKLQPSQTKALIAKFTNEEIKEVVKFLVNGKACGERPAARVVYEICIDF